MKSSLKVVALLLLLQGANSYAQTVYSPWTPVTLKKSGTNVLETAMDAPLITQEIINNGAVIMYLKGENQIVQLPDYYISTVSPDANPNQYFISRISSIKFFTSVGKIRLVNETTAPKAEESMTVRYVIIPGEVYGGVKVIPTEGVTVISTAHSIRDNTISGEWTYTLTSSNGSVFSGKVELSQTGETISGELYTTDGTKTHIIGSLIGEKLNLFRETGVETTQVYNLARVGENSFSGTFKNEGKYADSGKVEFTR